MLNSKSATKPLPAPTLPGWLTRRDSGAFVVDVDKAYPIILGHLGVEAGAIDHYWLETAFQCAKLAVQSLITGTAADPRPERALVISMEGGEGYKDRWAHKQHPVGRGAYAATKGLEAKQKHFPRVAMKLLAP